MIRIITDRKSMIEALLADALYLENRIADMRNIEKIENDFPDIAEKYFDMKFEDLNKFGVEK